MLPTLLLTLISTLTIGSNAESLEIGVDIAPHQPRLGDVVYVKIMIKNTGKEPIALPGRFKQEWGTLIFELYDYDAYSFRFQPDGGPVFGAPDVPLAPGASRVIYDQLQVPPLKRLDEPFWRPDSYELHVSVPVGGNVERWTIGSLDIQCRREQELKALAECLQQGHRDPRDPPGWDWARPSPYFFGIANFAAVCSTPEKLAELERTLSKGSLWNVLHTTRLWAAHYDAKEPNQISRAAENLKQWLTTLPTLERSWHVNRLVKVARSRTRSEKGERLRELAAQLVPLLPDDYDGYPDYRARMLKEVQPIGKQ
jgi:hypothetical protein